MLRQFLSRLGNLQNSHSLLKETIVSILWSTIPRPPKAHEKNAILNGTCRHFVWYVCCNKHEMKDFHKDQLKFHAEKSRNILNPLYLFGFYRFQTVSIMRCCNFFLLMQVLHSLSLSLISRVVTMFGFHLPLGLDASNISSEKIRSSSSKLIDLPAKVVANFQLNSFIAAWLGNAYEIYVAISLLCTFILRALTVQSVGFFFHLFFATSEFKIFRSKRKKVTVLLSIFATQPYHWWIDKRFIVSAYRHPFFGVCNGTMSIDGIVGLVHQPFQLHFVFLSCHAGWIINRHRMPFPCLSHRDRFFSHLVLCNFEAMCEMALHR